MKKIIYFFMALLISQNALAQYNYTGPFSNSVLATTPIVTLREGINNISGKHNTPYSGQIYFDLRLPSGMKITGVTFETNDPSHYNTLTNGDIFFDPFLTAKPNHQWQKTQAAAPITAWKSPGTLPITSSPGVVQLLTNYAENVSWKLVMTVEACTQVATATEQMTWTGTASTDWNNACNWSPNGVPTATNPVVIPNFANDPVIMSGTTANAFKIDIGNNARLTVNSGGELNVLTTNTLLGNRAINIFSNATLTNRGTLNATTGNGIDAVVLNDNATFNNSGTANFNTAFDGIFVGGSSSVVNNEASGIINFQTGRGISASAGLVVVINNRGTMNYTATRYFAVLNSGTTFNNSGTIDIKSGSGIAMQGATLNNLACGKILMSAGSYDNSATGGTTTNAGLIQIPNNLNNTGGTFTNTGVLKYGTLTGTVTNNQAASVIVNNTPTPIFTYGGTYDGTVNGIFKDDAASTSAGTFTAPNTFAPSGLPVGSQTLYAKITPSGGACTYIVPFTYNNGTCTQVATATDQMTWTGAVSTDWNNTCNWSPNGIPTATNYVNIPDVANDPVVLSGTVANCLTMTLRGILTINNGGELNVLPTSVSIGIEIKANSTLTNNGRLNASTSANAILIRLYEDNATFNNNGTTNFNSPFKGLSMTGTNVKVNNTATGIMNFQDGIGLDVKSGSTGTITNQGTMNYTAAGYFAVLKPNVTFNNSGTVDVKTGGGILMSGGTMNNLACGKILISNGSYDNKYSSTTTNAGLIIIAFNLNTDGGTFTNNGVLKYLVLALGTVINNQASSVIVKNQLPIFTYGGTYNGTINGIFKDAAATTSAGTFTAPNTFVPSGLPLALQTLYAKITPSGGACTYIVPFNYGLIGLVAGAITNPTTCGGTGSLAFKTTSILNGTYPLSFTKDGANSSQNVTVTSEAFTLSGLTAGVYTNFSLNVYGSTAVNNDSKTIVNPPSPTLTAGAVTNTTTCGGTNGKIAFTSTNLPNGDYSVSFTPSAGATASPQTVTVSGGAFSLTGLKAGTYSAFSVQNKTTLCTGSLATPLTVAEPLTPTIVAGTAVNPATCGALGSIPFTTTNLANVDYELSFTATGTGATTSPQTVTVSNNAFSLDDLAVGTYSNFSLTRTGCTATSTASRSIANPATPTLVAGTRVNPTACGGVNGSIPFTTNLPNGMYDLTYTGAGSPKRITVSNGAFTLSGLRAGGYNNFSITNNGCKITINAPQSLSDPNPPVLTLGATRNPTACNLSDGSIAFTSTNFDFPGSHALSYSLNGVVTSKIVTINGSGAFILTGLADGIYGDFSITNTSACTGSLGTTVTLTDLALPVLTLGTNKINPTTCGGTEGSIAFTTTNLPDATYSLSFTASAGATTSPQNVVVSGNAFTLSGLKAGTYSAFSITRSGCVGSLATSVTLTPPLTPTIAVSTAVGAVTNPTTCLGAEGEIDFTSTNLPNGTHSLAFTASGTGATPSPKNVTVSNGVFSLTGLKAGTYSAFSITRNNCVGSDATSKTLTDPATPTITAGTITRPTGCTSADGKIAFTSTNLPDGDYTLNYTLNNASTRSSKTVSILNNAFSLTGLDNGDYSNFSIINRSCTATNAVTKTVLDPAAPTLTAGTITHPTTCAGTNGSIAFTSTNLPNGTYSLTFTATGTSPTTSPQDVVVANNAFTLSGLKAGIYSGFTVKNIGCTGVEAASKELTDPAAPNITAGLVTNNTACGNATGTIAFTSTNLPNATYSLTFTATGTGATASPKDVVVSNNAFNLTNLKAGTYTDFSVTRLGCTDVETATKTVSDPPAPTLSNGFVLSPTSCGGTGRIDFSATNLSPTTTSLSMSFTATGAGATTSPQTVSVQYFAAGGTYIFPLVLKAGTYNNFSITHNGCTGTSNVARTLSDPSAPTLTVGTATNPTMCGGTEGSIAFTSTNLPNGTYSLAFTPTGTGATASPKNVTVSNNAFTLTGLKAGTYSGFSLISNGCTGSVATSKTLTDPAALTLLVGTAYNPTTCSGTEGAIAFTSTNLPDGTYSLSFTPTGAGATTSPQNVIVTGNAFSLTGLKAGTYSGFSIINNGCTGSVATSKTLTDPSVPTLTAGMTKNPTSCGGSNGNIEFTTTNLINATYTLNYSKNGTATTKDITVSNNAFTLSGLGAGTYTPFSIINVECTASITTSKVLTDPTTPTISAGTAINPATCGATGSIPFTSTNLADGTYSLTFTATGTGATTSPKTIMVASNSFILSGLAVGTYSNFSLIRTGCTANDASSKSITNPTTPTLTAGTAVNPMACGGTTGSIPFTTNLADGTYSLSYSGAGSPKNVSVTGGMFTLGGLASGGYSNFSITTNNCIGRANVSRSLSDPTPPVLTLGTPSNPTACNLANGSIAFTVTNITNNNYTLSYSVNGNSATKLVAVASGAFTLTGLADGIYGDFSITNASGCTGSLETEVTLTDLALPVLTLGTPSNPTTCAGTEGSIPFTTANLPDGPYSLIFTASAGATTSPQPVTVSANKFTLNGLKAGDYSNFYIERSGCRGSVATLVSLTAPATPSVSAGLASNPTTCAGADGEIEFTTTNLPNSTYSLSFTATGAGATTSPKTVTVLNNEFTLTGLKAGTYSAFSITNNNCVGSDAASKALTDPATPTITAGLPTAPSSCSATDGRIAFTSTNLPNGDYRLVYSGAGSPKTVSLLNNAFSLTGLDNGIYRNFSLENNGCTASDATSKTVNDPSAPTLTAGNVTNTTTCASTDGKIAFTTNLGTGTYTLNYTGAGSPKMITVASGAFELTGLPDGNYSGFSITHAGCTSSNNVTKTVSDPAAPTLTAGLGTNPTTCVSTDGKIAFTTSLPNGSYSISYTGAGSPKNITVTSGAFELTGLPDGIFSGFSITKDGCTSIASTSKTLTDPAAPTLTAGLATNPTTCGGTDGSIAFTSTNLPNGTYDLAFSGTGVGATPSPKSITVSNNAFSLTGLKAGTYSAFSVTNAECTGSVATSKTLTDPAAATLTAGLATNPTGCAGTNGSIAFTSTNLPNGTYSLSFTASAGATTSPQNVTVSSNAFSLSGLKAGTYSNFSVLVSGCTASVATSKILTDPSVPTLTAGTATNPTTCGSSNGSIAFTSTNLPNGTYSLSFTASAGATTSPKNVTVSSNAFNLTGLRPGTYSNFSITNPNTGCTGSVATSKTVSEPPLPTIAAGTATHPTTCGGMGSIPFTTTNLANGTYLLSFSPTGTGATASPKNVTVSGNAFTLSGLSVGTYSSFNLSVGCPVSDGTSKSINNPTTPTLTAGTAVNPMACGGTDGSIPFTTNLADGTYSLSYTGVGSPKNVTVTSGAFTLGSLASGGYSNFSITNNSCTSRASVSKSLSDPTPPVLTLGTPSNPTACNLSNGSITFTVTNVTDGTYALTYSGAGSPKDVLVTAGAFTLTALGDGKYSGFSIKNTGGCTGSLATEVTLTDLALPVLTLGTPSNPTTCAGTEGSIAFTTANLPDASYVLNFTPSAGATTSPQNVTVSANAFTINGLKAGDYSNFSIERLGCRGSVATLVSLTAPATPSVTAGLASNPTTCAGAVRLNLHRLICQMVHIHWFSQQRVQMQPQALKTL